MQFTNKISTKNLTRISFGAVLVLLLVKFLLPLFIFDLPLGYDPGIYRYLFVRHAQGFPPFVLGDIDAWATGHPLGLFFFTSILIKMGIPVDWFMGWIWNLMPVALLLTLAWATSKTHGKKFGIIILLVGLISTPYYDGFTGMYWKTYFSLLFVVLTFGFLDRRSWIAVPMAVIALASHHQTGLLFALALGTHWIVLGRKNYKEKWWKRITIIGLASFIVAAAVYAPVWKEVIAVHIPYMLTKWGDESLGGSFPPAIFYLRTNGILLALGILGFVVNVRRNRKMCYWHYAALWAAALVILRFYFYRRFYLHLDFFLIPFAAYGITVLWKSLQRKLVPIIVCLLLVTQGYLSIETAKVRVPDISSLDFKVVSNLEELVPEDAYVIALENRTATWMLGWLPMNKVAAPGLFNLNWDYETWEKFLLGSEKDRSLLLKKLKGPVYFVITPLLINYYKDQLQGFVDDPCIEIVPNTPLLRSLCSK